MTRTTLADARKMPDMTDYAHLRTMTDADIAYDKDSPELTDKELMQFRRVGRLKLPKTTESEFFKESTLLAQGFIKDGVMTVEPTSKMPTKTLQLSHSSAFR
jgi:hypothetical protein